MEPFNYIQSFIVKKDAVNNSPKVFITSIDLYFKNKPSATNNTSGINNPGVTVHICPFDGEVPNPDVELQDTRARAEWGSIPIVADASVPTKFVFSTPIVIQTDRYYGLVVDFDDEDFELFMGVQNETILNTTQKYSGSFGEGDGKIYMFGADSSLKPLSDRDLKFELRIAKFTANTISADVVNENYEFFSCNNMSTAAKFKGGELVYSSPGLVANATVNTYFSLAGNTVLVASNNLVTGVGTLFTNNYSDGNYVLFTNASNTSQQELGKIKSVISDTILELEDAVGFGNTCWHNKVVVGEVFQRDYITRSLYLINSTAANSTVRFHTNSVQYFTISNPGGSYTNGDIVTVSNGSINSTAVLVTNATGNVVSLRLTNAGGGFPNTSHSVVTITAANGSATLGSGASLVPVINTSLRGAISAATADLVSINDVEVDIIDPTIDVGATATTSANLSYAIANTTNYVQSFSHADLVAPIDIPYAAKIMSRSNELKSATNLYNTDKSSAMRLTLSAKVSDVSNQPTFYSPYVLEEQLDVYTFANDADATTANLDSEVGRGSSRSKHITKKISLANNTFAEDIRVFVNAYKPANTDIRVYAKIHNTADNEPYDDKSWTPLQLVSGNNIISATFAKDDVKEYEYGFPAYPDVQATLSGTGTTELANAVIRTTSDLSSNLTAGDLVRVYNPLFSTTNYMVAPVSAANSTTVTLTSAIANNGLVGSALKIDKLKFKNTAFNNVLNDNVVRYYTTSMAAVDAYDSMSVKIVFLSDAGGVVPEVDDIRVIAVSV